MTRAPSGGFAAALALGLLLSQTPARADDEDGAYDRLDGDLELELGAGAALASGDPALDVEAGALYLATAGVYGRYLDALGASGASVARSGAVGVVLRPLFLGRYAKDLERGPARLDLLVDSIGLSVGAFWAHAPRSAHAGGTGLELGAGIDVPISSSANGLYLGVRGALRWRRADLAGASDASVAERGALVALTLGWRHVATVHLVDAGDRLRR